MFEFRTFRQIMIGTLFSAVAFVQSDLAHAQATGSLPDYVIEEFGQPPAVPDGPLSNAMQFALRVAFVDSVTLSTWDENQRQALAEIAKSKDPRLVWLISDLMRFVPSQRLNEELTNAASDLLGKQFRFENSWGVVTDHLLAWDIPAPPEYLKFKRAIFTSIVPGWEQIFVEGDIDWRLVSWGGVLIDDRPYDTTDDGCNCIPAADNPDVSSGGRCHLFEG